MRIGSQDLIKAITMSWPPKELMYSPPSATPTIPSSVYIFTTTIAFWRVLGGGLGKLIGIHSILVIFIFISLHFRVLKKIIPSKQVQLICLFIPFTLNKVLIEHQMLPGGKADGIIDATDGLVAPPFILDPPPVLYGNNSLSDHRKRQA
jgi:hypothetical protein